MKVYCLACQKRCKGEVLRVQEQYMHKDCFKCAACSVGLEKGGFFVRDAKFYCPDDYQKQFGVRCRICTEYVTGEVITALGSTFHPRCFKCQNCQGPFAPGDRVTLWSNQLYLCKGCSQRDKLKENVSDSWGHTGRHHPIANGSNGIQDMASASADEATVSAATTSSTPLPRSAMAHAPPHQLSLHQHSPTSFSCPSESGVGIGGGGGAGSVSGRRFPSGFGSHLLLTRSYLSMEQDAERRTHPNDRYRRTTSPSVCGSIVSAVGSSCGSSGISPRHFHLPHNRTTTRQQSDSVMSRSTHPGSIAAGSVHRPGSVAGGSGRRTPRSLSPSPGDDPLLLSLYPGGSKPDLRQPAPIERDNWPAPAFSSLLLAEVGRRRRGDSGAETEEVGRSGGKQPGSASVRPPTKVEQQLAEGKIEVGGLGAALLFGNGNGSDAGSNHHYQPGSRVRVPLAFTPAASAADDSAASDATRDDASHNGNGFSGFDNDDDGYIGHGKSASLPPQKQQSRQQRLYRRQEDLDAYPDILGLRPASLNAGPAPPRLYPYEVLRKRPTPKDADPARLEDHLADDDFARVFSGIRRRDFRLLPEWKRNDLKRKAGLF